MTCGAGEPAGILPDRGRRNEGEEAMKTLFRGRASFDAVYEHILHMADVLADGILEPFPARAGS